MRPPDRRPPRLLRWLFRVPALAYRLRLGWVFGRRLVLVEHVGRRTGRRRRVVLEVVDRDPAAGTLIVVSGYGPRADWYRNLLAHPRTRAVLGRRRLTVTAEPVPAATGAEIMTRYASRHPRTARRLLRTLGYEVDGSDAGFAEAGRLLPFLRLVPTGG